MTALNFLIEVMRKLNDDPGMFETYQKELNSIYIEFAQNEYVISNAIEIIFDQVMWSVTGLVLLYDNNLFRLLPNSL